MGHKKSSLLKPALAVLTLSALFAAVSFAAEETSPPQLDAMDNEVALPDSLERYVRGCTIDGYIYRLPYNLSVDMNDLTPSSLGPDQEGLLDRIIKQDPDSLSGTNGSADFMQYLKDITENIHKAMQKKAGPLIDDATSELINDDLFTTLLQAVKNDISRDIEDRYEVTVSIQSAPAVQQGGRCPEKVQQAPEPKISPPPAP